MAELMRTQGPPGIATVPVGFHTFNQEYDDKFAPWFDAFMRDLSATSASGNPRLAELQARLEQLVELLQRDRSFSLSGD